MTVLKVPSTLVSTGSRLSYPRLDGYAGDESGTDPLLAIWASRKVA